MGNGIAYRAYQVFLDKRLVGVVWALGMLAILAGHLLTLTTYPPVFVDESWGASIAWSGVLTGANDDRIQAGPLDQFEDPAIVQPVLGYAPFRSVFALFGPGLFQARLVPWFFGALLLVAVALVGHLNYGRGTGMLAALLVSLSPPFLLSSHTARMDIIVAAVAMLSLALTLMALRRNTWWLHLVGGLLLGLSLDIHENGALFLPGMAAMYLVEYRTGFWRRRGTWLAAAGALAGLAYYVGLHILPDPKTYLALNGYWSAGFHAMPLEKLSVTALLASIRGEIGRYRFYANNLDFALIGSSLAYLAWRRSRPDRLLLAFLLGAFISFVLIQGQKFQYYAILLYPLFLLIAAETLLCLVRREESFGPAKAFSLALVALFLLNSAIHVARPIRDGNGYDYNALTAEMRRSIPSEARVMGAPTWWLGLRDLDYRSDGVLQLYNHFNGYTLTQGMEAIRPDILIFDGFLGWNLLDGIDEITGRKVMITFPPEEMDRFLAERCTQLAEIDNEAHGLITIYAVNWGNRP